MTTTTTRPLHVIASEIKKTWTKVYFGAVPYLAAMATLDTIRAESDFLNVEPNMWLGYNAFNEILHNGFNKSFELAKTMDSKVFDTVYAMAN